MRVGGGVDGTCPVLYPLVVFGVSSTTKELILQF
jgi:hypothetical protein